MIAGILMIIVFLMAIIGAGDLIYLILIFGVILLFGALCAIKLVYWPVAVIASVLGMFLGTFAIGPYYLASILSLAAFLLLIMSGGKFTPVSKSSEHFVDAGGFGRRQGG